MQAETFTKAKKIVWTLCSLIVPPCPFRTVSGPNIKGGGKGIMYLPMWSECSILCQDFELMLFSTLHQNQRIKTCVALNRYPATVVYIRALKFVGRHYLLYLKYLTLRLHSMFCARILVWWPYKAINSIQAWRSRQIQSETTHGHLLLNATVSDVPRGAFHTVSDLPPSWCLSNIYLEIILQEIDIPY